MYHAVHCEKRSSDLDLAETERVVQYRPNKPTRIGQSYCLLSRTFCIFYGATCVVKRLRFSAGRCTRCTEPAADMRWQFPPALNTFCLPHYLVIWFSWRRRLEWLKLKVLVCVYNEARAWRTAVWGRVKYTA